ncbi:MAG: hypothetical protein ACK4ZN_09010 [Oceanibaculum sp.]
MTDKTVSKRQWSDPRQDIFSALTEILAEVEKRGCEGHWLSRSSPLVGQARVALAKYQHQTAGMSDAQSLEFALRELIWRVDHVRQWLADHPDPDRPADIEDLLETSGLKGFLREGTTDPSRTAMAGRRRRSQ